MLNKSQIDAFWRDGFVVVPGAIGAPAIAAMREALDAWIEESRGHGANYGATHDGKARFDLEAGHTAAAPRLRRVANPADISEPYRRVLWDGVLPDLVAQLIGENVKFHHSKLNIKLPGMKTRVDWHQDHPYDPHTNDDMLATLTLIDAMSVANGCLYVVPGSHRGEKYSHYENDAFVGRIEARHGPEFEKRAVPVEGKAGDVCLMHTWTVHGGPPNDSDRPRRLLICDYVAADAFPLAPPAMASEHTGRIVRGKATRMARLKGGELEVFQPYADDSFFGTQGQATAGIDKGDGKGDSEGNAT